MAAFDAIGETPVSLQDVAHGWQGNGVERSAVDAPFEESLRRVATCCEHLRSDTQNASEIGVKALEKALGQITSDELSLKSVLALRDERARLILEALQLYLDQTPKDHPRRRSTTHLIIKLAHRSGQLPRSLFVEDLVLEETESNRCGGFGDVYRGTVGRRPVAVKKPRVVGGKSLAHQRLCREALVWRQLCHPNVLPFLGLNMSAFPKNSLPSLLSPWMEYGSLKEYIERPEYSAVEEIPRLLEGIAQGLAYLHSLSITHGDIKHLNILIDHLRCPRLADFGLVRLDDSVTLGGFTQTANGLDLRWASPQRLDDAVRALSDDVYSFGCIGYYLFSGLAPFHGSSDLRIASLVGRGERPSRPVDGAGCIFPPSDDVWAIITRCWAQECEIRPTMADVCTSLKDNKRVNLPQGDSLIIDDTQAQTEHSSLSDEPSYCGLEVNPTPLSPETWSNILSSFGALDLLAQDNAEMNQLHSLRFQEFSSLRLPRLLGRRYNEHVDFVEDMAERANMDRVSPWSVGPHYGPVLDPFIVAVVKPNLLVNPLLETQLKSSKNDHLNWDILWPSSYCSRSCDPPIRSWSEGRDEPATFPRLTTIRIISSSFPWIIVIKAADIAIGITCGNVVNAIDDFLHGFLKKGEFESASRQHKKDMTRAYHSNRSTAPDVPGRRLGEGMRRLDWLVNDTIFGGIRRNDAFVRAEYGGLPATIELRCKTRISLTKTNLNIHEQEVGNAPRLVSGAEGSLNGSSEGSLNATYGGRLS